MKLIIKTKLIRKVAIHMKTATQHGGITSFEVYLESLVLLISIFCPYLIIWKGEGFKRYTAVGHQGAIQMFWLQFKVTVMSSILFFFF